MKESKTKVGCRWDLKGDDWKEIVHGTMVGMGGNTPARVWIDAGIEASILNCGKKRKQTVQMFFRRML